MIHNVAWSWPSFGAGAVALLALEVAALYLYARHVARKNAVPL